MFGGVIRDGGRACPALSGLTQDSADVTVFSLVVFASSFKSKADLVFSFSPWSVSVLSDSGVMSWAADFPSFHAWEGLEWCQADFQLEWSQTWPVGASASPALPGLIMSKSFPSVLYSSGCFLDSVTLAVWIHRGFKPVCCRLPKSSRFLSFDIVIPSGVFPLHDSLLVPDCMWVEMSTC